MLTCTSGNIRSRVTFTEWLPNPCHLNGATNGIIDVEEGCGSDCDILKSYNIIIIVCAAEVHDVNFFSPGTSLKLFYYNRLQF